MLVWNILLTVAVVVEAIIFTVTNKDLYTWIDKFDKLMSYNPYNVGFRFKKKEKDPYDSTPEFIEGIKSMVEELERPQRPYTVRYNPDVSVKRIEELEDRVDTIAECAGAHDDRLDEHESEITELNRRVDNLEKYCYGTKEKDDGAD